MKKFRDCNLCVGNPECKIASYEETKNNVCPCDCHYLGDGFGPLSQEDY